MPPNLGVSSKSESPLLDPIGADALTTAIGSTRSNPHCVVRYGTDRYILGGTRRWD